MIYNVCFSESVDPEDSIQLFGFGRKVDLLWDPLDQMDLPPAFPTRTEKTQTH